MTIERKVGMGIAGQPSGGAANVADVFSTHLYIGNGNTQQNINNGIDLDGEGGMVWFKARSHALNHVIFDTERWTSSDGNGLYPHATNAEVNNNELKAFNSNGFRVGDTGYINDTNKEMVAWTFRKKKKFFDIVTYSGNDANRTIAHSLGGPVGFMAVKRLNSLGAMTTFHTSLGGTKFMEMHSTTQQQTSSAVWNNTAPTNAVFSLGTDSAVNASGGTYVAYLWADNSAEDAEDQMIKCGSYTGAYPTQVAVNLGWEPQWIIVRPATQSSNWDIIDNIRGNPVDRDGAFLSADTSGVEGLNKRIKFTATGFETLGGGTSTNANGATHIYMAIRGPMMVEPEAATGVFSLSTAVGGASTSVGFVPDTVLFTNTTQSSGTRYITSRLTGKRQLRANTTNAESSLVVDWDAPSSTWKQGQDSSNINLFWKRAKGFMDVVAFTGNATAGRAIPHSLGVAPEIVLLKSRGSVQNWYFLNASTGGNFLLNTSSTDQGNPQSYWGDGTNYVAPTTSNFTIGSRSQVNASNVGYIAFLFATLDGISKVGSYTGNGSSQTINCGFSAGARFVLIKRANATGPWMVFDTARGIVAGNDPYFYLDSGSAQITAEDAVDPHNSGFIINQTDGDQNVSGSTYIFYAIA